jgi:hypothetical protein
MPSRSSTGPGSRAEYRVDKHDSDDEHGCRVHEHGGEVRISHNHRVMYSNDHYDDLNDAV